MAQAAAPQTGRLRGDGPDIFTGDRAKSETFMQQFDVHWGLNDNHEIMRTPYLRAMYLLSLIKGPLVNDWVNDQVTELRNKVTRQQNPIDRDEPTLWNEIRTAFIDAYADTAKAQYAYSKLQHLTMNKGDLDTYISTFKHLARDAGYDLNTPSTVNMFAKNLDNGLLNAILHRDAQPVTMDEWITSARNEKRKYEYRQALMNPQKHKYKWVSPQPYKPRNGQQRHRNDETVPMDVDPPTFTRVYRAYTEDDKSRFKKEGRCFFCDKQGHMARECPEKKRQSYQPNSKFQKKPFNRPKRSDHKRDHGRGYRKSNKHSLKFGYTPQVRVASIEEMESESEEEQEEQDNISSLAARTARLSDDQKEEWLNEMKEQGIHF